MIKCTRIAAVAIATGLAGQTYGSMSYTFDADVEGWGSINDTSFFGWDGTLGNPDTGALRGVDRANGAIWYYAAPTSDLGNLSSLYGESISYDILGITGSHTSLGALADIIISGPAGDIGVNIGVQPVNGQWTSWASLVDASSGWEGVTSLSSGVLDGVPASMSMIQDVLANVEGVYVRGEYTNGGDSTALDNVRIVPATGSAALLGLGLLAGGRRRR